MTLEQAQLDAMFSQKIAFDVELMDNALLSHTLQFYNLVITWLLRMVDPRREHPSKTIRYESCGVTICSVRHC
jgi:ubiquitin conjugation factor E4 B